MRGHHADAWYDDIVFERIAYLTRFGGDLLSHTLRCSTIGATALNFRDRDGIGCFARAMTTKPRKRRDAKIRPALRCALELNQGLVQQAVLCV